MTSTSGALEDAGLEPYRVDQDPSTEKIIETIEDQIRKATLCLADITTDNPNVWYELGYAFAVGPFGNHGLLEGTGG